MLPRGSAPMMRSEEHTSELLSPCNLVCRLLLEKRALADALVAPGHVAVPRRAPERVRGGRSRAGPSHGVGGLVAVLLVGFFFYKARPPPRRSLLPQARVLLA